MRRVRFLVVLVALAAPQARAEFPEQSIKVIVPFAPGRGLDGGRAGGSNTMTQWGKQ
jgi:tripartite-type tricarboxylate transporter receptor subunit TctC